MSEEKVSCGNCGTRCSKFDCYCGYCGVSLKTKKEIDNENTKQSSVIITSDNPEIQFLLRALDHDHDFEKEFLENKFCSRCGEKL